jgi:hypothetical protein
MDLMTIDELSMMMIGPPLLLRRTYNAYCKCGIRVSVFNIQRRGGICRHCCRNLKSSFIIKRLWRQYRRRKIRNIAILVVTTRLKINIDSGLTRIIYKFLA